MSAERAPEWSGYDLPPFELDGVMVRAMTTEVAANKPGGRGQIRWQIGIENLPPFVSFEWHPSDTESYVRQRVIAAARVYLRTRSSPGQPDGNDPAMR